MDKYKISVFLTRNGLTESRALKAALLFRILAVEFLLFDGPVVMAGSAANGVAKKGYPGIEPG